jgi:hypothetical protein
MVRYLLELVAVLGDVRGPRRIQEGVEGVVHAHLLLHHALLKLRVLGRLKGVLGGLGLR